MPPGEKNHSNRRQRRRMAASFSVPAMEGACKKHQRPRKPDAHSPHGMCPQIFKADSQWSCASPQNMSEATASKYMPQGGFQSLCMCEPEAHAKSRRHHCGQAVATLWGLGSCFKKNIFVKINNFDTKNVFA